MNGSPDDTLKAKYAINEWILKEQASVRPVFEVNWATGKIFVDIPLSIRGLIFGEKGMNIRNLEVKKSLWRSASSICYLSEK